MASRETLSEVFSEWFRAHRDRDIIQLAHALLGSQRSGYEVWLWIAASRARLGHTAVARHACLALMQSDLDPADTVHARALFASLESHPTQSSQSRLWICPASWSVGAKRDWLHAYAGQCSSDPLALPVMFVAGMPEWRRVILGMPQLALIELDETDAIVEALARRGLENIETLPPHGQWSQPI